ncbi:hypothetical protein BC629DRAFT_1211852 [Irpex lacteus]|nr:hypothetical protein BC629DRAFT_1211852 [Irpex lacteus]
MASTTSTPRRSSRRAQPSEHPTQPAQASSSSSAAVLHTRNVKVALDLTPDQWDELRGTDIKTMQTHFLSHHTTTTNKLNAPTKRVYGKAKARPSLARDELKIGDTVLVELGGGSTSREPSVAVVTGVWKVMIGEEVFCVNVGVHWFVRPSQLPRVRAAREHLENEIYYSLSENDVVPLDAVVGHCTVTSNKNDNDGMWPFLTFRQSPSAYSRSRVYQKGRILVNIFDYPPFSLVSNSHSLSLLSF